MHESRKRIIVAISTTIVLVGFLSFLSYQFFPEPFIPASFALVWLEGKQEPTNNTITLLISTLSPTWTFQNETCWWTEELSVRTYGIPEAFDWIMLKGEHNATWLKSIEIQPYNIICTPTDLPFEGAYNITMTMNTTIHASLETIDTVDLGVYDCWNKSYTVYQNTTHSGSLSHGEPVWNNSGHWKPESANWEIDDENLSSMLQGSGTALITFRGKLSASTDYEITINGVKKRDERTLSWEGNMGIIKVTYAQSRIIRTEYEIPAIGLTMLTMSQ